MAVRDVDYWMERLIQLDLEEEEIGLEYLDEIIEAYELAQREIKSTLDSYIAIIAVNNVVSMAEARRLLTTKQLSEFRYDLKRYREVAILAETDTSWIKKLDNARARVNVSRLEAMEMGIEQSIQVATAKRARITTNALADVLKDSHDKNSFIIQKGVGNYLPFTNITDDDIAFILKKPWAPDGMNFSARIWADRDKLVYTLKQDLTQQLITGQDINLLFDKYEKEFGVKKRDAQRLIRTESTFFAGVGRLQSYKESGVEEYEYVAILDSRTSDICSGLDGKRFKVSQAQAGTNYPAMHVNCRSTTIPIINFETDEFIDRLEVDRDPIPASTGFKKWSEEVGLNTNKPNVSVPQSVYPPRVVQN